MSLLYLNDDGLVGRLLLLVLLLLLLLVLLLMLLLLLDLAGLQHMRDIDAAGRGKVDRVAGVVRLQVTLEVVSPAVGLVAKCASERPNT